MDRSQYMVLFIMTGILIYIFRCIDVLPYDPLIVQMRGYPGRAPTMEFPFKNIHDENGQNTNTVAIVAPFREKAHKQTIQDLFRKGYRIIGMTSYLEFPGPITNTHDPATNEDMAWYIDKCKAWLYCGRTPTKTFGWSTIPRIQMAQSDFTNPKTVKPKGLEKKWDFIYICLNDDKETCPAGWNSVNRNWELAKQCFPIMCLEYGLKGLIVGRQGCKLDSKYDDYLERLEFIPYYEFVDHIEMARFTFLPNGSDASPRILSETLCKNNPVLVNYNIHGGWKYVNSRTGEFFTGPDDIRPALDRLTKNYAEYSPREYFQTHYGPEHAGPKLAHFLYSVDPLFTKCKTAEPYCCK
jgi:hypothetical protein